MIRPSDETWDAVVVGGGPSGLAAATWLGRYRRRTLVCDTARGRNRPVEHTHGYLSRDGAPPAEILESARLQVDRYEDVERRSLDVVRIRGHEGRFAVDGADGSCVEALRVVLATGVVDVVPEVDGFAEHYGADVFHCPSCDGYEARGRHVVVLGWAEDVAGFALELLDWAATVTIVTDGRRFRGDDGHRRALAGNGVRLVEDDATAFVGGRGRLEAVRLRGGDVLACSMAFFSIGHRPRSPLAEALGCEHSDEGCVLVDPKGETTVPGVFAAGDITPGYQLLQVAAAKGATAGVGCAHSLRGVAPLPGRPRRAPDVAAALGAGAEAGPTGGIRAPEA